MLQHRILTSNIIRKNLNFKENDNKCVSFYKLDKNGKPIFRIGNNIILNKNIYQEHTYLCSFRDKNQKIFGLNPKNFIYICNLQILNLFSKKDLEIQLKLTRAVHKCPHFPIIYDYTICKSNDSSFKSLYGFINKYVYKFKKNSDSFVKSNSKSISKSKKKLPNIVMYALENKKDLLINFNEFYDGTLKDFIFKNRDNIKLITNAFIQIHLALLFFYQETGRYHKEYSVEETDYHYILYDKGGYFHYKIFGKDYYIENLGYLWTINNFSESEIINDKKEQYDYNYYFLPFQKNYVFKKIYLNFFNNINKNISNINIFFKNLIDEFIKNKFLLTNRGNNQIINNLSPFVLFNDLLKTLKNEEIIPDRLELIDLMKNNLNKINDCSILNKIILKNRIYYCEFTNNAIKGDTFEVDKYNKENIFYISHFKENSYKFITNILTKYNDSNLEIIKIENELTKSILKCHHFPILYNYIICKDNNNLIKFTEYTNGNLWNLFYNSDKYESGLFLNAYVQAFLALMFFYQKTGKLHSNYQFCNIQYHKIKEGSYYHYKLLNEDYYLYNNGYLFIITDFTKSKKLNENNQFNDFKFLFEQILNKNINRFEYEQKHKFVIQEFQEIYKKMDFINKSLNQIINDLIYEFVMRRFLIPKKKIPSSVYVINKTPYILNIIK